jgi:hypothetical protein
MAAFNVDCIKKKKKIELLFYGYKKDWNFRRNRDELRILLLFSRHILKKLVTCWVFDTGREGWEGAGREGGF